MTDPVVTIAVPSFNQGAFLDDALSSIFAQGVAVEVFVLDGGSTDGSVEIIKGWSDRLAGWRSQRDRGQAAAINEGIVRGRAPFVAWLNSDDWLLPGALVRLLETLERAPTAPMAYGRTWDIDQTSGRRRATWVQPFSPRGLAVRCLISQPGTLMRRSAWETVGGLDERLHMAMDYDLWWRLYQSGGAPAFTEVFVAVNRVHEATKTRSRRVDHYREAMEVVRRHAGYLPAKWWLARPYRVWWETLRHQLRGRRE